MKKLPGLLFIVLVLAACNDVDKDKKPAPAIASQQPAEDPATLTTIQWIDSLKEMGTINEGQQLDVTFKFKNTGDKPLIIRNVQPSCGCTAANPPAEPIAPGAEGEIKATFNSEGRIGTNRKTLTVTANTKGSQQHALHFNVEVIKKA